MNEQTQPNHDLSSPAQPRASSGRSTKTKVKWGIGLALLGLILVVQWPMMKGVFYGIVPPEPAAPEELPQWRSGYEAALAESRETGKPVLIDFTASWCPPCRVMEADVWPDEGVRETIADRVVPLQLDVDEPSTAPAAARYAVQYIPTIVLVDGEGNELARGSFMSAGAMRSFIEDNAPAPSAVASAK